MGPKQFLKFRNQEAIPKILEILKSIPKLLESLSIPKILEILKSIIFTYIGLWHHKTIPKILELWL